MVNNQPFVKLARADGRTASELALELMAELVEDPPDPEVILPLCKEVQARVQAVANRIGSLVEKEG